MRPGSLGRCGCCTGLGRCGLGKQLREVAQRLRGGRRLVELEADLQVTAVEVKLGNLIFLQEFNQLLKIVNILWFHSFLNSHTLLGSGLISTSQLPRVLKVQSELSVRG